MQKLLYKIVPMTILIKMELTLVSSGDVSRSRSKRWLVPCLVVTVGVQVPSIVAWLVLDSILLNGPLRLFLIIIALCLWRRV